MTDIELLELAAKAAGLEFSDGRSLDPIHYMARNIGSTSNDEWDGWNPLIRDRDAFRLAVTLKINIQFSGNRYSVSNRHVFDICCLHEHADHTIDIRRSIVMAAAELAKLSAQTAGQVEEG